MKRHRLSGKEIKALNELLLEKYGLTEFLGKQANVELVENSYLQVNGDLQFFYLDGQAIPTLRLILKNNFLKAAVIDMPAVRFIVGGADIMRPGIKDMEDFLQDEIIVIVDQNNHKPLAIGRALFSSDEMRAMDKGKVIKNLHYVGDKLWNADIGHNRPIQ